MRILVFGASGPTGRCVITQALAAGHDVTAAVRRPEQFTPEELGPERVRLTVREVDVLEPDLVDSVVRGSDVVLSTLGVPFGRRPVTVYSVGVRNILDSMERWDVRRLVVVSSSATDPRPHPDAGFVFNRVLQPFIVNVMGRTVYADMRRMEDLVRASAVDWTILRPSGLFDADHVSAYSTGEDRVEGRFTARPDLAAALLAQVDDPGNIHRVLAVATTENIPSMRQLLLREAFS